MEVTYPVQTNTSVDYFENLNIKTGIGPLLFNIILDSGFKTTNSYQTTEKHNHSSYEVHFILKGKGSLYVDGKVFEITPNEYYIIGPGIYHMFRQDPENPISKFQIKFDYTVLKSEDDFFPRREVQDIISVLSDLSYFFSEDKYYNISLIYEIHRELEMQPIGYYAKIQCLFSQIIINLLRTISPYSKKQYNIPQKPKDEQRSNVIENFFDDYWRNLVSDELASLLNLSNRQLNRVIKVLYNTTFKQKLLDTRMEVAKDLLKSTRFSIESIAEKVGYISQGSFYTIFKRKIGLTPEAYRKTLENKHS